MSRRAMARVLLAGQVFAAACQGPDDSDTDTGDTQDDSCPDQLGLSGDAMATTYTVSSGVAVVDGAVVYVSDAYGQIRSNATTASDGTATVDVVTGDAVTVDAYPGEPGLQRVLRTIVGVEAGAPLTLYVIPPQPTGLSVGDLPDLPITTPALGAGEWLQFGLGPCIVNSGGSPNGPVDLSWMPDCVDATEAGGITSAPLVIEALETSPNGDVRYLVVEDLTLGATDALAPAGPWSDGVSATLTLSGTGASYVAADVVAWHPVVGSIDSARVQGYTLQAEVTGGAGTATVAFSRVDLAADAAMVSFWQLGEGTYTVHERVPPSAWGAPIAIDNARTLTGTASVAFDVGCDQVLSSASPAADFVYLSLWEADGDMWGVMVPPSSDVTLPVLLGFGPASDGYYFEVDLVGAAYLDVGDDSSLPNPPRSRHERFGTVDLQ